MTGDVVMQRALLLIQQGRHADAERELRQALAMDPGSANAHAMLAHVLLELNRYNDAEREADEAIGLAPDEAYGHYARAAVLHERRRYGEAAAAIEQAIGLDPYDADQFAMLAQIRVSQREWKAALEAADRGLAVDPANVACANLRAVALVHLGRREDAARTIDGALSRDPDDPITHANQGWALLHAGEPKRAMEHFREALRLDPTNEWARAGIVEAMKARNPIYRFMLGFFLSMARLTPGQRWGIIIGGWFGHRLLRGAAADNPQLAPYIWPITTAYLLFVWMTWLSDPLFNAILRTDRNGRYALSREQLVTSNWILSLLVITVGSFIGWRTTGLLWLEILTVVALLLAIPVSTIWRCEKGWPRLANVAIAAALAAVGVTSVILAATGGSEALFNRLFGIFLVGTLIASLGVQSLARAHPIR